MRTTLHYYRYATVIPAEAQAYDELVQRLQDA